MRSFLTTLFFCALTGLSAAGQTTKSSFIKTSDGIRIHYLEAGQGRAIVFIPGWMMPGWIWQKQIDKLSEQYRVIAVETTWLVLCPGVISESPGDDVSPARIRQEIDPMPAPVDSGVDT